MVRRFLISTLIIGLGMLHTGVLASSISPQQQTDVRMLINLMDYIAKDYRMAVADGEVINEFEYAEMQEFSASALDFHATLSEAAVIDSQLQLGAAIVALGELITSKDSPEAVSAQARKIRERISALGLVPLSPTQWPDRTKGKALFAEHCSTCHGSGGKGDGPAGAALEPAPTNLTDRSIMDDVSPLQAFNTITLGIEGTSMRAFTELSEEEVWDLAFYIAGLPFEGHDTEGRKRSLPLEALATKSNNEIIQDHPTLDLGWLRTESSRATDRPLDVARIYLQQAESASVNGASDEAVSLALKAYLEGVEPAEPKIKASDNQLFQELESSMLSLREAIKEDEGDALQAHFDLAYAHLDEAERLLGSTERSMWMTAAITISILIREGLEAFFVILAILGILQGMGAQKAIRWVHSGWIVAVVFGLIGWFFAGSLMTWDAQSRELMEGVIALFAVVVLLYLGFWMHGKTSAAKWKAFVEDKVKGLISRNNMIGLASFSFLVVFREAFESVLFLSSLTVDGRASSSLGVLAGTIVSAALLFLIAWSMLRWFKRLPISKVFLYSSMVVLALAFVLAGEGVHAIQEGGYLAIRSFPINLRFSLIGLYPTYESILTQLFVLGLIIALWKFSSAKASKA